MVSIRVQALANGPNSENMVCPLNQDMYTMAFQRTQVVVLPKQPCWPVPKLSSKTSLTPACNSSPITSCHGKVLVLKCRVTSEPLAIYPRRKTVGDASAKEHHTLARRQDPTTGKDNGLI